MVTKNLDDLQTFIFLFDGDKKKIGIDYKRSNTLGLCMKRLF